MRQKKAKVKRFRSPVALELIVNPEFRSKKELNKKKYTRKRKHQNLRQGHFGAFLLPMSRTQIYYSSYKFR